MAGKRNRNRKARAKLTADPAELKRLAEEAHLARLKRDELKRRAEKQPGGFGVNEDALTLPVNVDVQVKRENGKVRTVWRSNPFSVLRAKGTINDDEANAGEDMVAIYAASKGLDGAPVHRPFWEYDPEGFSAEDRRRYFIRIWDAVLRRLSVSSRKLAEAFAYAIVEEDRPMSWGGIVQRETGAATMQRQSERFVMLCEELVEHIPPAWEEVREAFRK